MNLDKSPRDLLTRSNRLYRQLMVRVVTGLALTGLALGSVSAFLLYRSHARQLEAELSFEVELQATALAAQISKFKQLASQISSRTQIREALKKYLAGDIDRSSLTGFSEPKLADALSQSSEILGIVRLDGQGQPLIQVGQTIPPRLWPRHWRANSSQLGLPAKLGDKTLISVSSPIFSGDGEKLGIDVVVFDGHKLQEMVERFYQSDPRGGQVAVAAPTAEGSQLFFKPVDSQILDDHPLLASEIEEALAGIQEGVHQIASHPGRKVIMHRPIAGSDWVFLFLADARDFYAPARKHAIVTGLAFFAMSLLGSFLTLVVIRPLSGRISIETESLLGLLKQRNALLRKTQANQSQLQGILDNTPSVIYIKDPEGKFLLVNQRYRDLVHLNDEQILGKTAHDLFPAEIADAFRAHDLSVIQAKTAVEFDEQALIDGEIRDYIAIKFPLLDKNGNVYATCGISTDITERKRMERKLKESEERFRTLAEHSPTGIFYTNSDGDFVYVNHRCAAMAGRSQQDCLGRNWSLSVHPDDRERVTGQWMQAVASQKIFSQPIRFLHDNGKIIWTLGLAAPVFEPGNKLRGFVGTLVDISQQKQAEEALARASASWAQALDQFGDAICLTDLDGHVTQINATFGRLFKCETKDCLGLPFPKIFHPTESDPNCPICQALHAKKEITLILEPEDPSNPFDKPIELTLKRITIDSVTPIAMLISLHDLSRSRQIEERLRLAARVFENTGEGVVITDADGNIVDVNQAYSKILGYSRDEVIGRNPRIWNSGLHDESFYQSLWRSLEENGFWQGEVWNRRKDGTVFPEWLTISKVVDDSGKLTHYVGVFSDISRIKQSQEKLNHLAHHDALTDLPNRVLLTERLEQAIRHAVRHQTQLVVIFIDLDNFKHINDSFGHPIGDQLLKKVAATLVQTVRAEDTVARLGGDEFVILLEEIGHPEDAAVTAEKLIAAFRQPIRLDELEIHASASLGISVYPRDGQNPTTLLRNADAAMYRAKEEGRNTFRFYTEDLTKKAFERVFLETNLRQAIENHELFLLYQPQIDLETGSLVGLETLIRWQHPKMGLISPSKFVPLAEQCGLIQAIGAWVLHSACRQGQLWLEQGLEFGRISVNVAGPQIQRGQLVEEVGKALAETGFGANHLELEVTENFIMQPTGFAVDQLKALRQLGVTLAIDDFGTGHSSLSYLKKLPIQKLKIDQSFIRDIPGDPHDMAIAEAIIALGKCLDLTILAEGVETRAQLAFLEASHCHQAQGFLFCQPLTADDFPEWLASFSRIRA